MSLDAFLSPRLFILVLLPLPACVAGDLGDTGDTTWGSDSSGTAEGETFDNLDPAPEQAGSSGSVRACRPTDLNLFPDGVYSRLSGDYATSRPPPCSVPKPEASD
jgi:hypothetical protein